MEAILSHTSEDLSFGNYYLSSGDSLRLDRQDPVRRPAADNLHVVVIGKKDVSETDALTHCDYAIFTFHSSCGDCVFFVAISILLVYGVCK